MTNTEQQIVANESDISLNDIMDFFVAKWKALLKGALLGLAIALGGTLWLGKYEAEATLINRSSIDYLTWKSLKRNLPILAARISDATNHDEDFRRVLSSEAWWQKNVIPTFAIAKEDTQEIFGASKELQGIEATQIKDFVVKATGPSKEEALKNLSMATSFLREGAAYLAIRDVVSNYQIELLKSESEIAKKISALEIDLAYLNGRKTDLELLKVKFPANFEPMARSANPTDYSTKYLPLTTQLIAVYKDISTLKEDLSRLNDRRSQLSTLNSFLSQAKPVMDRNFDGLSAIAELMKIESGMRKELQPSDWNKVLTLNNIKYELALIHSRFTLELERPSFISTHRPHYLRHAAVGLVTGFILALLGSLCFAVWLRYRRQAL